MKTGNKTPTIFQLSWTYFIIGLTAYSMAMLEQLKALVINKGWMSEKEVEEGLAMVELYPGPLIFNLATYIAYRIKGFLGASIATFMFILPSYILMTLLSFLYFHYGKLPWIHPVFIVIESMVIGIILHISLNFTKKYVNNKKTAVISAVVFLMMLYKTDAFIAILAAMIYGIIFMKQRVKEKENIQIPGKLKNRILGLTVSGIIFLLLFFSGIFFKSTLAKLLFGMFKIGAFAFGNGMSIIPLLEQVAVFNNHWLSLKQFTDGIAFGTITPGPFLITATFIGYKVAGIAGSIAGTLGMFYPSFFYTLLMSEIYIKIKHLSIIQNMLTAMLAGFSGMLFYVLLTLSKAALISNAAFIWATGAFILVRFFKLNILWIFSGGILIEIILYISGIKVF
jgi:chromate transporter